MEGGLDAVVQVFGEFQRGLAVAGHPALQREVGEVVVAQQRGLFTTQLEDLPDQRRVIVIAFGRDFHRGLPDLAADAIVVEVLHQREHRGHLQREAPGRGFFGGQALGGGVRQRGGLGRGGQARELRFVGEDEVPRVGRVEDVLGILLGELRKFGLHGSDTIFLVRRQVGTRLGEVEHGLLDEALLDRRQRGGGGRFAEGLEHGPQARVQRDGGVVLGDIRQHRVEGGALGGLVAHRVQVLEPAPTEVEEVVGLLEGTEGVLVGGLARRHLADRFEVGLGDFQRVADVRLHRLRHERGPADVKAFIEKRMHGPFPKPRRGGWECRIFARVS